MDEMMEERLIYNTYARHLLKKYGEKVYKLPVNLPVTCPNRMDGSGCIFCSEKGTGFESLQNTRLVTAQLEENREYIRRRYKAEKFIAYFQNYTNTFMPLEMFRSCMEEAAGIDYIAELAVSTRPDCISAGYLDVLKEIKEHEKKAVTIELGLQTVNYHTLDKIGRGHGLAEFIDAVLTVRKYGFDCCAHVILNLPSDNNRDAAETARVLSALPVTAVKIHSLYIPRDSRLGRLYEKGEIALCTKEEYLERLASFIASLRPDMVVERLFSRIPEEDSLFSNWGISWWKLKDEFMALMEEKGWYQGSAFNYLNGAALKKGGSCFGIRS